MLYSGAKCEGPKASTVGITAVDWYLALNLGPMCATEPSLLGTDRIGM